ncbi:DNA polymerase-like protein [Tanacetum coccineum]
MYPYISRDDCHYTDTDSVVFGNPLDEEELSPIELGKFKEEAQIIFGYFLAAKQYYFEDKKGKETLKHKGAAKNYVKKDTFEALYKDPFQKIPVETDSIFDEFSLPRPPKIPSFSQDEMDLVFDDSIPLGIDDDDDSEGDILFVEPVATMENNIEELNEDESFDPGEGGNVVLPNVEEDDTFTFIICTLLPFVTYPEVSLLSCSTRSEDTIFDPGISTFHFSSLKPVAYENPMVIFLFFYFYPKDKGIRGESS